MSNHVPDTVPVRRNRVGNIDDDRLNRRRNYLVSNLPRLGRECDNRCDFTARVCELAAIEVELVRRELLSRDDTHCLLVNREGEPLV